MKQQASACTCSVAICVSCKELLRLIVITTGDNYLWSGTEALCLASCTGYTCTQFSSAVLHRFIAQQYLRKTNLCELYHPLTTYHVPVLPVTEHHAMKAYWGSGGTAPPIL